VPDFIPYLFQSAAFQRQAEEAGIGSVMRHFGPSHLRAMTLPAPPREQQQRVVGALSAVDSSLDAGRRHHEQLAVTFRAVLGALLGSTR
jgi:type I restriction enzyme S subunit